LSAASAALSIISPVWAKPKKYDVIVVGAGLSGLHTTHLLEQYGLNVLLLEGNHRVGGRVHTLDDIKEKPDAGATQVGGNYFELRKIIQRLEAQLVPATGMPTFSTLSVNQQLIKAQNWGDSAANVLPQNERAMPPAFLLWRYLGQTRAFDDPNDWLKPEYRSLDIPLKSHLKALGASDEAIRLMNCNFESNSLEEVSALHTIRKFKVIMQSGGAEFIKGGTSRLPELMAGALKSELKFNKAVSSIRSVNNNLIVSCEDGSSYVAPKCVFSTPFSTLRHIDLQLGLSSLKRQAINKLLYNSITQVFLRPTSAYWEQDSFSADMWTDSPIGMVTVEKGLDEQIQLLRVWLIGDNAKALDMLDDSDIGRVVINELAKIRPATQGKLALEKVVSWGKNKFSAGAFAHFKPGDAQQFAANIASPEAGLHFVGEHTNFEKSGMEAAVLSAQRGVKELVQSL
jgi:monoamine oxidase